jgi:hypothetical protein
MSAAMIAVPMLKGRYSSDSNMAMQISQFPQFLKPTYTTDYAFCIFKFRSALCYYGKNTFQVSVLGKNTVATQHYRRHGVCQAHPNARNSSLLKSFWPRRGWRTDGLL